MNEQVLNLKINSNIGSIEKGIENLTSKFKSLNHPIDTVTASIKKLKNELSFSSASKNIQDVSSSLDTLKTNSETIVDVLKEINNSQVDGNKLFPDLSGSIANLSGIATIASTIFKQDTISNFFNKIPDIAKNASKEIGTFFSTFKGNEAISGIFSGLKESIGGVTSSIGGLFSSINPTVLIIGGIALLIVGIIAVLKNLYDTNEEFRAGVDNIIASIRPTIETFFETVGNIIGIVMEVLQNLFENVIMPVADFLIGAFKVAWENISTILENFIIPIITNLIDTISWLWENVLKPVSDFLIDIFLNAWQSISTVFETILLPIIQGVIDTFTWLWNNVLKPICDFMEQIFKNVFERVFKSIGEKVDAVKSVFEGIITFITGIFSQDWEKAWEGIKKVFSGIWEGLKSVIKTPVNKIIDILEGFINKVIDGWNGFKKILNKFKIDIPDWLGGGSFGFKLDMSKPIEIKRLENGGFPTHGSMFIAGENGPEIVGHIGSRTEVLNGSQISGAIYNAVATAMKENSYNNRQDIRVYAEEGLIVEKVSKGINQHVKQTGNLPFTIPI